MEYPKVSPERARIAVQRLINSHFHNDNRAQCRIPADPENDDDLLAVRYIKETEDAHAKLVAALKELIKIGDSEIYYCPSWATAVGQACETLREIGEL